MDFLTVNAAVTVQHAAAFCQITSAHIECTAARVVFRTPYPLTTSQQIDNLIQLVVTQLMSVLEVDVFDLDYMAPGLGEAELDWVVLFWVD
jgi:hypothetical protein